MCTFLQFIILCVGWREARRKKCICRKMVEFWEEVFLDEANAPRESLKWKFSLILRLLCLFEAKLCNFSGFQCPNEVFSAIFRPIWVALAFFLSSFCLLNCFEAHSKRFKSPIVLLDLNWAFFAFNVPFSRVFWTFLLFPDPTWNVFCGIYQLWLLLKFFLPAPG